MKQEVMEKVLAALPGTAREIAKAIKMNESTVLHCIGDLHKEKRLHIGGWRASPGKGPAARILHLGEGKDKPFTHRSKKEQRARVKKYRKNAKARKLAALLRGEEVEQAPVETTVQHAMRTQPASVFSLACSA